jgi:hypothetical protein
MSRSSRGSAVVGCVAWLALLMSLAALVLAWAAFRHAGGRLDALLDERGAALDGMIGLGAARDALGRGESAARWRAALEEAEARLQGRRAELETRRDLAGARHEVDAVRADLARAFADAGAAARARWQTVDGDLDRLDRQLREGSSEALSTLDGVVERIRHALAGAGGAGGAGGRRGGGSGGGSGGGCGGDGGGSGGGRGGDGGRR